MLHWLPKCHAAQEPVEEQRAAAGKRAKDMAMADLKGSPVGKDRHLHPTLYIIRLKIKIQEQEAIVERGKLVDHPFHHRLLLLCASQCHNSLLVLDRGDGVEGTRGSPR